MSTVNIFTPKISRKYETLYYYKQKFVNWEFTGPGGYVSTITTPKLNLVVPMSTYILTSNYFLYSYTLLLYKYVTEQSFKTNSVYYQITSSTQYANSETITINSITHKDPALDLLLTPNVTLKADHSSIEFTTLVHGTSAYSLVVRNDDFVSNLTFNVYSTFFRKSIEISLGGTNAQINFIGDQIQPSNLKLPQFCNIIKSSAIISKAYMFVVPPETTNISLTTNKRPGYNVTQIRVAETRLVHTTMVHPVIPDTISISSIAVPTTFITVPLRCAYVGVQH